MTPPLVSVIMPCLNAERHIQMAIDSVLAQTFDDFELIVVDNGSTDRTSEILSSVNDPRLRVFTLPERGVSRARNLGLREARGTFIAFLDSDDTWSTGFLEKMHRALAADSKAALAYCGWQNLGLPRPRGEPFIPPDYETPEKVALLLKITRWPIHAALTKLELIRCVGGFDETFVVGEDMLLWLEIGCTHKITLVPEVLAFYHHHGGHQASKDRVRAAEQIRLVQDAFLARHPGVWAELGHAKVRELTDGALFDRGVDAYWRRDLETARKLFRLSLRFGGLSVRNLRFILPALLPEKLYRFVIETADRRG